MIAFHKNYTLFSFLLLLLLLLLPPPPFIPLLQQIRSRKNSLDRDVINKENVNDPWGWFEDFEATPWTKCKDVNLDGISKKEVKNVFSHELNM